MKQQFQDQANAIIFHKDKLLLFQRDDKPGLAKPLHWQLPGGGIEPGETPDDAVRRELVEEVSYVPKYLTYLGKKQFPNSTAFVYWAYVDEQEAEKFKLGESEGQAIGFFTIKEALDLPLTSGVRDHLDRYGRALSPILKKQIPLTSEMPGLK